MRVVRTRRGARIEQDGLVLSEISRSPGPTDSLFDVLAAAVAALAPGPRLAMLGFAGGGVVAPLRAMGFGHPVDAVDLDLSGERLFRELSGPWAGRVHVARADAVRWLRAARRRYDVILEDLSVPSPDGVTKPAVSLEVLPRLIARRLDPRGLAITNVLPVPGVPWARLLPLFRAPFGEARVVLPAEYENRIVIAGRRVPSAAAVSRTLRRHLEALGSDQARDLKVRDLSAARRRPA